jgi:hypothetical protein
MIRTAYERRRWLAEPTLVQPITPRVCGLRQDAWRHPSPDFGSGVSATAVGAR